MYNSSQPFYFLRVNVFATFPTNSNLGQTTGQWRTGSIYLVKCTLQGSGVPCTRQRHWYISHTWQGSDITLIQQDSGTYLIHDGTVVFSGSILLIVELDETLGLQRLSRARVGLVLLQVRHNVNCAHGSSSDFNTNIMNLKGLSHEMDLAFDDMVRSKPK